MKVGVIGTSNTVRRGGYVDGLATTDGLKVERIGAIGESLGLLYAMFLSHSDHLDFCVADFSVNEETFLRHGAVSKQVIVDYLHGCFAKIWADGCLPLALLLPLYSIPAARSTIRSIYYELCSELNVPLFDGIALIDEIQRDIGVSRDLMFEDEGHLYPWLAYELGRDLGEWILSLGKRPWDTDNHAWSAHVYDFRASTEFELEAAKITRYSSTLISFDMACLGAGARMAISADANEEAVGLCTSLVDTEAVIELAGEPPVLYDSSNAYPIYRDGFLLSVQAFPKPRSPYQDRFSISVVPRDALGSRQVPALVPQSEYARNRDLAVIGGMFVRNFDRISIPVRPSGNWRDLSATNIHLSHARSAVLARSSKPLAR